MNVFEIALSFFAGLILLILSGLMGKMRMKGIGRLLLNALFGGLILLMFSILGVKSFPLNPLNALLTGYLGIFGIALIWLITKL